MPFPMKAVCEALTPVWEALTPVWEALKPVWEALTPRGKLDWAYHGLVPAIGMALTISICSVPSILFVTLSVSRSVGLLGCNK